MPIGISLAYILLTARVDIPENLGASIRTVS